MELQVGDKVKVIDCGKVYTIFDSFMRNNKNQYTKPWAYDVEVKRVVGRINAINNHPDDIKKAPLAIVNTDEYSFIIGIDGLEKIDDKVESNIIDVDLKIENIVKEEVYYIETNLGKFDVTAQINKILNNKI